MKNLQLRKFQIPFTIFNMPVLVDFLAIRQVNRQGRGLVKNCKGPEKGS